MFNRRLQRNNQIPGLTNQQQTQLLDHIHEAILWLHHQIQRDWPDGPITVSTSICVSGLLAGVARAELRIDTLQDCPRSFFLEARVLTPSGGSSSSRWVCAGSAAVLMRALAQTQRMQQQVLTALIEGARAIQRHELG